MLDAGLIVSVLIFQQGWALLMTALRQLTDAGVSTSTKTALLDALRPLVRSASSPDAMPTNGDSRAAAKTLLAVTDLHRELGELH